MTATKEKQTIIWLNGSETSVTDDMRRQMRAVIRATRELAEAYQDLSPDARQILDLASTYPEWCGVDKDEEQLEGFIKWQARLLRGE